MLEKKESERVLGDPDRGWALIDALMQGRIAGAGVVLLETPVGIEGEAFADGRFGGVRRASQREEAKGKQREESS